MKTFLAIFTTLATACGTAPANVAADATAPTTTDQRGGPQGPKGDAGPSGPKGEKGDKGDAGSAGTSGKDGSSGKAGSDGKDGLPGAAGAQGVAGTSGSVGATGAQGAAGTPAVQTKLIDSTSGATLGEVSWLSASGDIWIVNGAMRFTLQNSGSWAFPNAYLLYPQANCAGTPVLTLVNGEWANIFVDGRDSTTVWGIAPGARKAVFNYQSRVSQSNSCQNTTGNTFGWAAVQNPTLPFAYPVNSIEFAN